MYLFSYLFMPRAFSRGFFLVDVYDDRVNGPHGLAAQAEALG